MKFKIFSKKAYQQEQETGLTTSESDGEYLDSRRSKRLDILDVLKIFEFIFQRKVCSLVTCLLIKNRQIYFNKI